MKDDRIIAIKLILDDSSPKHTQETKLKEAYSKVSQAVSFFNGYEITVTMEAVYKDPKKQSR